MRTLLISCLVLPCAIVSAQSAFGGAPPPAPLKGEAREVFVVKASKVAHALGFETRRDDWVVQPDHKGQIHATIAGVASLTFDRAKSLIQIDNLAALAKRAKEQKPNPETDIPSEELQRKGKEIVGKAWGEKIFTACDFPGWLLDGARANLLSNSGATRLQSPVPGGTRLFRVTFAREDGAFLSATCLVY